MVECIKEGIAYICSKEKYEQEYKPKGWVLVDASQKEKRRRITG